MKHPCTALLALLLCLGPAAAPAADKLPVEAFAALPMVESVTLAPGGKRYAALLNKGDSTMLVTRELAGGEPMKMLLQTDNKKFRFSRFHWVSDERIVVGIRFPSERRYSDATFADSVETRLVAVDRRTGDTVNLVKRSMSGRDGPSQFQDRVVDWLEGDGHHILVSLADEGDPTPGVYKIDVDTGRRTLEQVPRSDVIDWITDPAHHVRVAIRSRDAKFDIDVCDTDGTHWRTLWHYEAFSPDTVWPLGFGRDPQKLYVTATRNGVKEVAVVDLRDPALKRETVLSAEGRDVGGALEHAPDGEAIGVGGAYWDTGIGKLRAAIDKALPARTNRLDQFSADGQRYLVFSEGNGAPGVYLVGQRSTGQLALLAETYPQLPEDSVAKKKPITIAARDGTPLPSYLTLPPGATSRVPMVLLPHGGPISEDTAAFDPWVALFAHRGYAVLQVNYRGSGGFGVEHRNAGLKRWGLEMQDDLTDAVAWAVKEGVADPARVCIVGGSYGGYAALMGVVKTPDLYRCAASFAGISDLLEMSDYSSHYVDGGAFFARQVGSDWSDRDQLKATSPRRQAEKIKAPVLLVHGTLDRQVPFEQSELMADALKGAGKTYRFVKLEGGDHQLSNQATRTQFFRELDAFLAANLKP